jgi:hypothetical protein
VQVVQDCPEHQVHRVHQVQVVQTEILAFQEHLGYQVLQEHQVQVVQEGQVEFQEHQVLTEQTGRLVRVEHRAQVGQMEVLVERVLQEHQGQVVAYRVQIWWCAALTTHLLLTAALLVQ